jgi:hypothetical protein
MPEIVKTVLSFGLSENVFSTNDVPWMRMRAQVASAGACVMAMRATPTLSPGDESPPPPFEQAKKPTAAAATTMRPKRRESRLDMLVLLVRVLNATRTKRLRAKDVKRDSGNFLGEYSISQHRSRAR